MKLIIATRNQHKVREFRELLGDEFQIEDLTAYPGVPEVAETGKTFAENAALKAVTVSRSVDRLVIADDSGLEVDSLGGAPGIYSARYSGEGATDERNIEKLLDALANQCHEQRTARFRCVIVLAKGDKAVGTFAGTVEGRIIDEPRGTDGFGYDPVFQPNGYNQTFGELASEVKNRISHRAEAAKALRRLLQTMREQKST